MKIKYDLICKILVLFIFISFSYSSEKKQEPIGNKGLISLDYILDNPVGSFIGQAGVYYWVSEYPVLLGVSTGYALNMSRGIKDNLWLYTSTMYNFFIAKTGNRDEVFLVNFGLFVLWCLLPDSLNNANKVSYLPKLYSYNDKTTLAWNYQL